MLDSLEWLSKAQKTNFLYFDDNTPDYMSNAFHSINARKRNNVKMPPLFKRQRKVFLVMD